MGNTNSNSPAMIKEKVFSYKIVKGVNKDDMDREYKQVVIIPNKLSVLIPHPLNITIS